MLKHPTSYPNIEATWKAYYEHRFHPSPKWMAEIPMSDMVKNHINSCAYCQQIQALIEKYREEKSPRDWCDVDPYDFGFVDIGDIRTLAFDRISDEKRGNFMNAPEVCVIAAPPRISFEADVVVAQAIPERFSFLCSENQREDIPASGAGYILEAWNIYTIPMVALINFGKSQFPTVYKRKAVPMNLVRQLNSARKTKFKPSANENIEKFRESERVVGQLAKKIIMKIRTEQL